ncbi:LacI family DNA-binding transcriptional regulator [uncultured Cohaesibacter sp.]|uniref:LacI family DNA-binding transcriptional regulator n=1 Tax=uncultured Cohaesibacter sp. TaxID=1002546 RepID=UPI002930AB3F|nr:LacI family DNA-binding transcriptional regulator [uncultured Cohaesibacter sp.]
MKKTNLQSSSVTVADVARHANVSKSTAARVLGGYGVTSEKVRERVHASAKALKYRANELARSMTTGKSKTIGVVVGDIENSFFGIAVRSITDVLNANGFNVILANSDENFDVERDAVNVLVGKQVDGLIVAPANRYETAHLENLKTLNCAVVLFDREIPSMDVDTVISDDADAARNATEAFIAAGHRRLAFVTATIEGGREDNGKWRIPTSSVGRRIDGFLSACKEAGIAEENSLVVLNSDPDLGLGASISKLLDQPERPTAILASDSIVALEIFKQAQKRDIEMPDALSLIAFHNADWTEVTRPTVTVIDQPVSEMGRWSAEQLIKRIEGSAEPALHHVMKMKVINRQSVTSPK